MTNKQLARLYLRAEAVLSEPHGYFYTSSSVFRALSNLINGVASDEERVKIENEVEQMTYMAYPKAVRKKGEVRIIVAGTRTFKNYNLLKKKLDNITEPLKEIVILSGCAEGADELGELWAFERLRTHPGKYGAMAKEAKARYTKYGKKIGHVERYPANWKKFKKKAGPIRNKEMVKRADCLVAFWDGKSPGTKDIIALAKKKGLKVRVIYYLDPKYKTQIKMKMSAPEPEKKKLKVRLK